MATSMHGHISQITQYETAKIQTSFYWRPHWGCAAGRRKVRQTADRGRWLSTYWATKKAYHGLSVFHSMPVPLQAALAQLRPPSSAFH